MTFIKARNGRLYPASRILSISEPEVRRGEDVTDVELESAGPVEFYSYVIRDFLRQPVTSFVALPETYIIYPNDEAPSGFLKTPVVGWSAARDGGLYPITAEGVNDCVDKDHFVLTPDGQVSQPEVGSWGTVEQFLAEQQQETTVAAE